VTAQQDDVHQVQVKQEVAQTAAATSTLHLWNPP
jgi:hypothetical protein